MEGNRKAAVPFHVTINVTNYDACQDSCLSTYSGYRAHRRSALATKEFSGNGPPFAHEEDVCVPSYCRVTSVAMKPSPSRNRTVEQLDSRSDRRETELKVQILFAPHLSLRVLAIVRESKEKRARAIRDHAWTRRTPPAARIARIPQNLSGRDFARSAEPRRVVACASERPGCIG